MQLDYGLKAALQDRWYDADRWLTRLTHCFVAFIYYRHRTRIHRVVKNRQTFFVTSSNIDQLSNLFHCYNQEKICNNTITEDRVKSQVCHYSLHYLVKW